MEVNQLKPLVNHKELWYLLDKYLEELYNNKHKELENITDINQLFRLQGFVQAIKHIRELKSRANVK